MRRFVPPVLTTAATAGIVYWSLVTVTAASSLLKKSAVFELGERKESGCAASRINRSPQAGSLN